MEFKEFKIKDVNTIFVPARAKVDALKVLKKIKVKEKKIGLLSTIQFRDQLEKVKEFLEKKGYEVHIGGQVVGCNANNALKIKDKVDIYLYIGSGEFHPIELVDRGSIADVYIVNPFSEKITKFTKKDLEMIKKRKDGKISKFLMSKKIGILVSTKPGQEFFKTALNLVKRLDKESYVFLDNEIDLNQLENFNDIEFWINTACKRLEGKNILPLADLMPYLKKKVNLPDYQNR